MRQGFYRLPLRTIDAVRDGELKISDWTLFVWLAANADYKTGIVRTSAPVLAAETGSSVVTIRKTLRRLRDNGWIFYTTDKSKNQYPIGIYNYLLEGNARTMSPSEWRLHYGNPVTLISASPSWINVWINVNNEFSVGQLGLRESAGQSGGQSAMAVQAPGITGDAQGGQGGADQCAGQSADQSAFTAALENANVDLRSDGSTHATLEQHSTSDLHSEMWNRSNGLNGKIWSLYERKYRRRTKTGIGPSHSLANVEETIQKIRLTFDDLRKPTTTDDQYLSLVGDAFDIYFRQRDNHVTKPSVNWNLKTFLARLPGILEEIERRYT